MGLPGKTTLFCFMCLKPRITVFYLTHGYVYMHCLLYLLLMHNMKSWHKVGVVEKIFDIFYILWCIENFFYLYEICQLIQFCRDNLISY